MCYIHATVIFVISGFLTTRFAIPLNHPTDFMCAFPVSHYIVETSRIACAAVCARTTGCSSYSFRLLDIVRKTGSCAVTAPSANHVDPTAPAASLSPARHGCPSPLEKQPTIEVHTISCVLSGALWNQ